ncbi:MULTISPECIES: response regulator [Microvirga]|uniref:response regulator n=1 Tax=Microvirga TaxID=186650 RepID=UPI001CFF60B3|nr:response regulator [Microvirga lenta]MCB5176055.1 response regulator [Microvirga lenta]
MSSESRQPPVIVLVEEETTQREAVARYLEGAGFAVIEAETTDVAMALLDERSDIRGVVTDAHVPGNVDGFELAELVRKRWPTVAVVMMSGHSDATSGPVPEGGEFISKPYLLSHLAPTLDRLVGRSP